MAAQLEVKCVSSVGKGSKEWPFTPAPTQPDFGLYRASPGFGATGCSDTCSGVWLQDLTSQHGFSSPGGNIPFSPRDEKHFTAFPRGPAAFPRLKGDPADLKSHKRGHDIREVSSLNRSREALHIAQLHHRLRGGQGFLGRGAPSGGKKSRLSKQEHNPPVAQGWAWSRPPGSCVSTTQGRFTGRPPCNAALAPTPAGHCLARYPTPVCVPSVLACSPRASRQQSLLLWPL